MKKLIVVACLLAAGAFAASAQEATTTVNVSAQVQQQASFLIVDTAEVEFGLLDPVAAGLNRFQQGGGPANLSWNAPLGTTWHIEVSTSNGPHFPGIVDPSGNHFLPLKYNHVDLGFGDPNDPDAATANQNWQDFFLWVFDPFNDGAGPGSDGFVTSFTSSASQPDIADLDFRFWLEVADNAFPAIYFGTVTFDLVVDALP